MRSERRFLLEHPSGRIITYEIIGDVSGRPVLYFHGWGSVASSVFYDEEFLRKNGLFILMVNRPGYGDSDLVKDYTMFDHAGDVKKVLDHLGIQEEVHCFGWSNGALFAQAYAYRYPESVAALSIAGSAIPLTNKESSKFLPIRWKLIRKLVRIVPFFIRRFLPSVNKKWNGQIGRILMKIQNREKHSGSLNDLKEQLKKQTAEGLKEAYRTKGWAEFAELRAVMKPFKLEEWEAPFPVHIWYAEKDNLWPEETALFLHNKYQGSAIHSVREEGHFFFLVYWKQMLQAAMSFE
ncbi:alpha/beta fold hydrolase [Bacillus salacetis]|uniref:alpha/beta fold hydrolase n=1 Tax=Bacillus salacetis TaxID=2315464 RepID=UPI003BA259DF